ncbi:Scr1 family TA system antitoxin-like transcriptional regulator [Streptomyces sp. NPDC056721]|uniref:Scr1 family TA system antitoxin-like transcriptional regulator n=1 Tax=unclassified Streptomyces TaxID=2593676 RepID=UPI00369E21FC
MGSPTPHQAIIHEAALRMRLGGTTVTERQLQHLIDMSEREREEACPTSPGRRRLRHSGSAGAGSRSKADWAAGVTGWLPAASVRRRSVRGAVGADFRRLIFVRGWGWPNFPSTPNGLRTTKDQRRKAGSNSRKSTRRVGGRSDVSVAAAACPGRADDRSGGRDLPLVSIWTARPKAPATNAQLGAAPSWQHSHDWQIRASSAPADEEISDPDSCPTPSPGLHTRIRTGPHPAAHPAPPLPPRSRRLWPLSSWPGAHWWSERMRNPLPRTNIRRRKSAPTEPRTERRRTEAAGNHPRAPATQSAFHR